MRIACLADFSAAIVTAVCPAPGALAQISVGNHVDASPYEPDSFGATVTGTVEGGYSVKMDGDNLFQAGQEFVVPANRMRAYTSHPGSKANAAAGNNAGDAGQTTRPASVFATGSSA